MNEIQMIKIKKFQLKNYFKIMLLMRVVIFIFRYK